MKIRTTLEFVGGGKNASLTAFLTPLSYVDGGVNHG
ncbi:hypothetical protein LAPL110952_09815 [Lactiplantibacillus plajomi]